MKKSFVIALVLLVTSLAYMAFITTRSYKANYADSVRRYDYPDLSNMKLDMHVSVWIASSDTTYLEYVGDTGHEYEAGVLTLHQNHNRIPDTWIHFPGSDISISDIEYKVGMKELNSLEAYFNTYYLSGFRQKKMQATLRTRGNLCLSRCYLDTLIVNCPDWSLNNLRFEDSCEIKHVIVKGSNSDSRFMLSAQDSKIGSLHMTDFVESRLWLHIPADILSATDLRLNGKKNNYGKPD